MAMVKEENGSGPGDTVSAAARQEGQSPVPIAKPKWSILTTMILYAGLLVTLVVASLGTVQLYDMLAVYDDFASLQEKSWKVAIRREGSAMAGKLAVTLAPAVTEHNYSLVEEIMHRTTGDDAILYTATFDESGVQVAQSGTKPSSARMAKLAASATEQEAIAVEIGGEKALLFGAPLRYADKWRGTVWLAYSLEELERTLARVRSDKDRAAAAAVHRTVVFGLAALAFGLILSVGQGLRISRPIRHLAEKAAKVAAGDLSAKASVKSSDEVGQLGRTFNFMTDRIAALLEETAEKVRLENEMEVASAVQERLVAPSELVRVGDLELAGYYQPASFCGGDFWNYFQVGPDQILLVVGDVTGHGIPSALLTATAKSCLDTARVVWSDRIPSLSQLVGVLNLVLFEAARGQMMMTCWVSLLDLQRRQMRFVNAGHSAPFFYRLGDGGYTAEHLTAFGQRLGDSKDAVYTEHSVELRSEDVLVWYTDGLTEGENPDGREFGTRRAGRAVAQNSHRRPDELRDLLVRAAMDHCQGHPQEDDITLVVAKLNEGN